MIREVENVCFVPKHPRGLPDAFSPAFWIPSGR